MTLALLPWVQGDVGWYDSGELTAAAAGLGVPHPTGFPLLVLLGHAAQLLPFGPIPFRVALLGAASIGLATALVQATAVRLGARPLLAGLGALFLPVQLVVQVNATVVEVYALNVALLAGLGWLLMRPEPAFRAAALLTGVGLGAHVSFVLVAAVLWASTLAGQRAWRRLPALVPWGLLGALVVLALPLAASRDPWMNWGDPSTPGRLLDHLTASSIRSAFADEMGRGGAATAHRLGLFAEHVAGPLAVLLLPLAALAGVLARPRWAAVGCLGALFADAVFTVWVNPMGQTELQTGTPGALALAWLGALGLGQLRVSSPLRAAVAGAATLALAVTSTHRHDERPPDEHAGRYGRLVLAGLEPGAVLLATSDHLASLSLYLQGVEATRPDVVSLVIQHLPDTDAVRRRYAFAGRQPPAAYLALAPEADADRVDALLKGEVTRAPVYWQLGEGRHDARLGRVLYPAGLVERLRPPRQPRTAAPPATFDPRRLLAVEPPRARTRFVLSELSRLRGVAHLREQRVAEAVPLLEEAAALDPSSARARASLAAARRRTGDLAGAIALLEEAVALDPTYVHGWATLGSYREAAGDAAGAAAARREVEALSP